MGGPAPERAAHAAQHLVGLNFVPSGQRAKRGLNSCPEDNESRGKRREGFRDEGGAGGTLLCAWRLAGKAGRDRRSVAVGSELWTRGNCHLGGLEAAGRQRVCVCCKAVRVCVSCVLQSRKANPEAPRVV